jgi:serine/threonine-protein kinase
VSESVTELQAALVGRYRIEREVGRGGMSVVYLARDLKHDRDIALKLLRPELAVVVGPERFQREIHITAQLQHPNILPVYDSGEAAGRLYYVMPYVEGGSLRGRLAREKQLPLHDALRIIDEVAEGLSYAHTHGVVHRDIKPENILLTGSHAVLADFGIARTLAAAREQLTGSGLVVGTPAYMSPEQAAGEGAVDARSDLYALGCVLYETLAGEPPFSGPSSRAILTRVLVEAPPSLRAVRPTVPAHIERAVERALAKIPADRFATVAEFARALDAGVGLAPARPPHRFPLLGVLLALGAALAAAGAVVLFRQAEYPLPLDSNLIAVAPFDVLDPKLQLWHEGLVDYLSRNLDGAGPLRTVSPTLVLRRWRGRADPASAGQLGRRVGARLVVFGQLVGGGSDSARLRLTVLDAATGSALATPERTDLADRVDRLADSLTTDVLRNLGRQGPDVRVRLAAVAATSLPALKAFLQGEQLLRRFSLDSALEQFAAAAEGDSTFALALRRLGLVRGWRGESGGSAALAAGRFNHNLAPRDSLLIVADSLEAASDDSLDRAYWSHRLRKFATLEHASRRYPEDPEVWYSLGEARFHLGHVVGSTAQQTVEAFDRAIALDSAFAPAYVHPVQLALDRNDTGAAQRYITGYLGLTPRVPEGVGLRLVSRLLDPTQAESAELQSLLDVASANVLFDAWRSVHRWPDSAEAGVRLLRLLTTGRHGIGIAVDTVQTGYLLATELLYRGHLREARAMVRSRFSVPFAELAMLGVVPTRSAAAAFDRWLRAPNERLAVTDPPWVNRCYRSFLTAQWWAQRQDTLHLLTLMRRGDSVARSTRSLGVLVAALGDARLGRAALALARRDTADALRQFLAFPDSLCARSYGALSPGLAPLRMMRFQLLAAVRRDREAALLFDRQVTLPLAAAAVTGMLQRGHVAERLGDRATAIQAYRFVSAVWRNSDPELRPYVAEARTALQRLGIEPP